MAILKLRNVTLGATKIRVSVSYQSGPLGDFFGNSYFPKGRKWPSFYNWSSMGPSRGLGLNFGTGSRVLLLSRVYVSCH